MKSLIVTVAGTATRFNRDTERETLKCLYHEGNPADSLLFRIVSRSASVGEIIIVGGYKYEDLSDFVETRLHDFCGKIKLVFNPEFKTYGSGYSLLLGIAAVSDESEEIIFVEGDLAFDAEDYNRVLNSPKNVLTVNHELILANKAVVLYEKTDGHIQYLYDTSHQSLKIDDPFIAIYNSAQIWKFRNIPALRCVVDNLTPRQVQGTNLEIIQGYFGPLSEEEYEIIPFSRWYNCNTVADFRQSLLK